MKAKSVVVATKHDELGKRAVTYQRELVKCGKRDCTQLHGPYWYAYWKRPQTELFGRAKLVKAYIGKTWRRLRLGEAVRREAPKSKAPLGNRKKKGGRK